jgi:hypothetical protein
MQVIHRVHELPNDRDKGMINSLEHWMRTLIAPSKQLTLKMNLFEQSFIEKPAELAHSTSIKAIIVLIFDSIDHIKVTT